MKIAAGYIRVSTQEQSTNGLSLESQRKDIQEYCDRNDIVIAKFYVDAGISARKNIYKREAFMEMMEDARAKKINHIVVIRLDRFFRNVYDYHRMMNEYLLPAGCGWSAVKEDYDTTTTNGRLMINLRLSIAEQECDQDSERIRDVFANRVKEGYIVTGVQPFGFDIVDKRLVLNSDAEIVKDIFREYLSTCSVRKTMVAINSKYGMSRGFEFFRDTISKPIYIGKHVGNDHYCEPTVSEEDFAEVQRILKSQAPARSRKRDYIFKGLLFCAECGSPLCGSSPVRSGGRWIYYKCTRSVRNLTCGNRKNTNESKIEAFLLANLKQSIEAYITEISAQESEIKPIKGNRPQIEKKIERVKEMYINGLITLDELKQKKSDLEGQIIEDAEPVKKNVSALQKILDSDITELYSTLTVGKKTAFWHKILKAVVCYGSEVKEIIFL